MLQITKLTHAFHKNIVLNEVQLDVKKGDLIYIHGINGSGKSTLFKIICDILKPDQGEITFDENVSIGALIENPGFLENESLSYNLKFLASLKNNYHEETIQHLCQQFQLDIKSSSHLKTYSLGMRQKAGIIQAIMEDQNIILLDEPTRGLDQESIDIFCQIINQFHDEKKTIIIASHDYQDKIHFNKIFHLKDGQLIQDAKV